MSREITLSPDVLRKRQQLVDLRSQLAVLFEYREHMISQEEAHLNALYIDLIGTLQYEEFALKVDVMRLKRKHQLVQSALNRGEIPDMELVEQTVAGEFDEYKQQIEAHAESLRDAKAILTAPLLSEDDAADMKRIYRLLVKRLHPDWNPDLSDEKKDLFVRAQAAYKSCDVQELRNILLRLEAEEPVRIKVETIDDDIARLERSLSDLRKRIEELEKTFPFDHRNLLYDKDWVQNKQEEIRTSISSLQEEKQMWQLFITSQTNPNPPEA